MVSSPSKKQTDITSPVEIIERTQDSLRNQTLQEKYDQVLDDILDYAKENKELKDILTQSFDFIKFKTHLIPRYPAYHVANYLNITSRQASIIAEELNLDKEETLCNRIERTMVNRHGKSATTMVFSGLAIAIIHSVLVDAIENKDAPKRIRDYALERYNKIVKKAYDEGIEDIKAGGGTTYKPDQIDKIVFE